MNPPGNVSSASVDPNDFTYSCVACERPDSADNVVACDRCDNWWHYTCAGVSDSIRDRDWTCPRCLPRPASASSTLSRMSSASRRQMLQLELQHLAEKRDFERRQRDLEAEKNFLEQKCKLLEATLEAENDDDRHSVRSRVSAIEARERASSVLSWVSQQTRSQELNSNPVVNGEPTPPMIHIESVEEGAVGGTDNNAMGDEETGAVRGSSSNGIALQHLQEQLRLCQQSATPTPLQLQILKEKVRRCRAALGRQTGAVPKVGPFAAQSSTLTSQPAPVPPVVTLTTESTSHQPSITRIQFAPPQVSQSFDPGAHPLIMFSAPINQPVVLPAPVSKERSEPGAAQRLRPASDATLFPEQPQPMPAPVPVLAPCPGRPQAGAFLNPESDTRPCPPPEPRLPLDRQQPIPTSQPSPAPGPGRSQLPPVPEARSYPFPEPRSNPGRPQPVSTPPPGRLQPPETRPRPLPEPRLNLGYQQQTPAPLPMSAPGPSLLPGQPPLISAPIAHLCPPLEPVPVPRLDPVPGLPPIRLTLPLAPETRPCPPPEPEINLQTVPASIPPPAPRPGMFSGQPQLPPVTGANQYPPPGLNPIQLPPVPAQVPLPLLYPVQPQIRPHLPPGPELNPDYPQHIPAPFLAPAPPPVPIPNPRQEPAPPALWPTPAHLAARQVMPRDLPEFSGDPEEWPIFLSSFNNSTEACGYNNSENLARLQRCLKGSALKSVRCHLLLPELVPEVIRTLQTLYGRPEVIINKLIRNMRESPPPKAEKLETLVDYGMTVRNLTQHLIAAGQYAHLANPILLQEAVEKLPSSIKLQWATHMIQFQNVTLQTFSDFMTAIVDSVSRVCQLGGTSSRMKDKGFLNTHIEAEPIEKVPAREDKPERRCHMCAEEGHRVKDCAQFKEAIVEDRWKLVQRFKLCRCCLNFHGRRNCRSSNRCGTDGCQYRHHPLLHTFQPAKTYQDGDVPLNHTYHHCGQSVLFRILPITIHGPTKTVTTYALLDEGSTATLVEQALADELGVVGPTVPLCLSWTANMTRMENKSQLITLKISSTRNNTQFRLDFARTVEKLNLSPQTLRFKELQERYPHLAGLPVDSYESAVPQLLIGLRNLRLAIPQQIREGEEGPCAAKTRLGWCVYGSLDNSIRCANLNYHACDCTGDERLEQMVRQYFNSEDTGTTSTQPLESKEEMRARTILEKSTMRVDGRYQTGLLWRYDDIEFPESFPMALRRLECLEKKMNRDPALKESVHRQVREYQNKGYAHPATETELLDADPRRVWYLPLGAVTNPKKPGKTRLVWDAAAQVHGISLNSLLLPGPDLLTPLPHVLFRFRRFPVAVTSDIKEMFHQIQISPADRNSQRFLFRDKPTDPPRVFLMDVATFGAASSPTTAQFIKNENARRFETEYPRAVEGILRSHYVDDYLDSFSSVQEANKVAQQVQQIHAHGGFQFHNWSSNSREVLEHLGEVTSTEAKDLLLAKGSLSERVLGMHWTPEVDVLTFSTSFNDEIQTLIETGARPTKRQMLKCIMSIFDTLGLLASFLVHGKVLMQDVWRTGIKWDEVVNEEIYERWRRWTDLFERVDKIQIPRCYFSAADEDMYKQLQVHVFVDASESAYSAAVYFRIVKADGTPHCVLVSAKTKVAPLRYHSIPRLELMAALLGVRLCNFVLKGHDLENAQRFFWSDSKTVLAWIRSDHRRYHQFVACRVGEILTTTNESQWRWVPTKFNVADEATKWGKGPCFDNNSRWFVGPNFLYQPEELWPDTPCPVPTTEEELRPCYLHRIVPVERLIDYNRFSSWNKLLRTTAYVGRFGKRCQRIRQKPHTILSHDELNDAQMLLWRLVQAECYPDEVTILTRNKQLPLEKHSEIPKSSPLYKLSVYLDENGVLRIDGRIGAAKIPAVDVKYPVVLPKDHAVTHLIVDDYHRRFLHGNSETVVNEVRQVFFVPQLRAVVRKVAQRCQHCIIYKAKPETPRMAPLPDARLSPFTRAFSYVGLDYFGPLTVKIGRSNAKRWVALFTCLTVRAVHMEIAHDLSTQSCISCIRRFIARRGQPVEIHSDNGRNFCGADKILREQMERITTDSAATFTNTNTKWIFTPPYTPHMGGSWERMVRSVKTAMMSLPQERKLDDEALQTVIVEAEAIVNSRPLTYLPLDSAEQEAITPNHFILLSSTGINQPVVRIEDPVKVALGMRQLIQRNLDHFWHRWVKEYLPTLTRRSKWFKETKPIQPGDLVVIVDETCRNGWVRGRVKEVVPGKDGRVRKAVVQTAGGLFRRAVANLAVLDVSGGGKAETGAHRYEEGNVATGAPQPATLPAATDLMDDP